MQLNPIPLILLSAIFAITGLSGQEITLTESTSARILGPIPGGTPSPPEPPKPEFVVPAQDIVESKTHQQGGRKITVQQIKPIDLPETAVPEPAITPLDPAIAARAKEFLTKHPRAGFVLLSATIYRPADGPPRTFVNLWPQDQGGAIQFWSSADFAYLSGIHSFIGTDGKSRSILMAWDNHKVESLTHLNTRAARIRGHLPLATLPEGKATFTITSGKPSAESLAAIQSLHDLYNNELPRLQAAYEGREKAQLAREAHLKANPPKPKDLVLNFWRTESPAPTGKGATR